MADKRRKIKVKFAVRFELLLSLVKSTNSSDKWATKNYVIVCILLGGVIVIVCLVVVNSSLLLHVYLWSRKLWIIGLFLLDRSRSSHKLLVVLFPILFCCSARVSNSKNWGRGTVSQIRWTSRYHSYEEFFVYICKLDYFYFSASDFEMKATEIWKYILPFSEKKHC